MNYSVKRPLYQIDFKKTANFFILINLFLCCFSTKVIAQNDRKSASENYSYGDQNRMPLLMPDNFDSMLLVSWRGEQGVEDSHNPLLEPAMPWDSGGIMAHGTVLHDPIDGLWKAWQVSTPPEEWLNTPAPKGWIQGVWALHETQRRLTYLESKDGIHWYRPKLPFVKWPGHDSTNILLDLNSGGTAVYASVLVDPKNKEWPYEMFVIRNPSLGPDPSHVGFLPAPSPEKRGTYRYRSHDGKDWKLIAGPLHPLGKGGDVSYVYRKRDGSYLSYFKNYSLQQGDRIIPFDNNSQQLVRRIGRSTSPDGNEWTPEITVLGRDWRDPGYAQFMELCPLQVEGGYFGMVTYYDASLKTISLQMAASRDGIHWWRPDRRIALPNPPLGDYGGGMMWQMHNPIVENGKMFIYYGGAQGLHGEIYDSRAVPRIEVGGESVSGRPTPTLPFNSALCRAFWNFDRLWALVPSAGGPTVGEAVTRVEKPNGSKLVVNVLVKKGGEFLAELQDESGKPIPGYTVNDCKSIKGDHHQIFVSWKGGQKAPSNASRIRFFLKSAFLYGYAWRK
jgi:hypothetical protein